jgi:hypothetical protein
MMQCSVCLLPKARDSTNPRNVLLVAMLLKDVLRQARQLLAVYWCLLELQRVLPFLGQL